MFSNWDINKNILDVVSGSTVQKRNEPQRHYHYGISDFDQRQVFITDGNEVYRLELNIANLTDGKKVAYVKRYIEKADYETAQRIKKAETAGKTRLNQPSGTSIRNPEPVVNKKFTLSDRVEQTKNLVAVHNLTEDKMLSTLKLGGFPMPSIAVTKSYIPHTNFGEISLVFGRETIDPKANRKNAVYSADAWTPTFPKVEYEANSKVTSRVYERLGDLAGSVDQYFKRDIDRARYGMEDLLNRYGGEEELIKAVMGNYGLKAAYLEEQGIHIEPTTKQES